MAVVDVDIRTATTLALSGITFIAILGLLKKGIDSFHRHMPG